MKCRHCDGEGRVEIPRNQISIVAQQMQEDNYIWWKTCKFCKGTGKEVEKLEGEFP